MSVVSLSVKLNSIAMKRGFAGLLVAVVMFAAPQAMTNQAVEAMVSGGVPLATIVTAIRSSARIQLTETRQDYDRLIAAGSSPAAAAEIMKAIHHRQYVGIDNSPVQTAATPAETTLSSAAAPVPVPPVQVVSVAHTETNWSAEAVQPTVTPAPVPPDPAVGVAPVTPAPAPIRATAAEDAVVAAVAMPPENVVNQDSAQKAVAPLPHSPNVGFSAAAVRRDPADAPQVFLQSASSDESMKMSKGLERGCPAVKTTMNQQAADYIVLLKHIDVGFLARDNQIQVANKEGGLIANPTEGGNIAGVMKRACALILDNWAAMRRAVQP